LHGTIRDLDPATGEVLRTLDTATLPDGVLYVPCGDRRASVCPACAETYRADTYQLIRAGLTGGKGIPETVAQHPCVFATFTAPSFGLVHTCRLTTKGRPARCRPRRKAASCPHGRRLSCGLHHKDTDPCLGKPLCPDCYDYQGVVVWNAHAPELWRRTTIAIRRRLAKNAKAIGAGTVQLSYAKVAEFQARGLVHFHAIFRLDTTNATGELASPALGVGQLTAAITAAAARSTWFATVAHPAKLHGWDIQWGAQLDIRTVQIPGTGQDANIAVASYLAKYATKSTEAVGTVACRITADNLPGWCSTTILGTPYEPRNFARHFALRCTKAGVRYIKVHDSRRTCASLLVALDVHPRVAMQILRHTQITVTMEVYSEVPSAKTRSALKRLGRQLDG
jgi:uncharacterized Zn-finger protein